LKAANTSDFIALANRLISDNIFYSEASNISTQLLAQFDKNIIRAELIDLYTQVLHNADIEKH
jgi:hypothetical protein